MDCATTRGLLVAFRDGELSPGEHELVSRHLETCARCAWHEAELAAATPEPPRAKIPAHLLARLDVDAILAEADRVPPPVTFAEQVQRAWSWEARVSAPAALAYAAALVLAFSLAVAGWLDAPAPTIVVDGTALPAADYQPASYDPAGAPENKPTSDEADGFR